MIILASQSPRRREILSLLGLPFEVRLPRCDEDIDCPNPAELVKALAVRKANACLHGTEDAVIAADTVVGIDGRLLGKPCDREEAREMLRALSGRKHTVYTGAALLYRGQLWAFCEETQVYFRELSDGLIESYVASGEPMDKAGAYGIQGIGGRFVRRIEGDYYNVMGLPLCALSVVMEEQGLLG